MFYVLFNPLSNNSRGEADAKEASNHITEEKQFKSVIGLNYKDFFSSLKDSDEVLLCGGDGTLNYFINEVYPYNYKTPLYFAKCGSGNDFYRDVDMASENKMIDLRPYIKKLPYIEVNGLKRRFINGIGYGIDGDTCLVGDEIREKDKDAVIDYTKIAISLLLGGFNTKKAKVEVDDKVYEFENVWLSSTMNGRFYGGGMNAAPNQDRLNSNGKCTVTTLSSKGRLITLLRFPSFSGGKHKNKKYIKSYQGKHIKVTFDSPCALQIDGDVVKDVTTYTVDFD